MSDDFGTVNLRPGARTRESELLRRHREMLVQMTREVDEALAGLEGARPAEPAMRPLVDAPHTEYDTHPNMVPGASAPRVVLMIVAALVALALIGWLIWRASSDRKAEPDTTTTVSAPVTETSADTAAEPGTIAPATTVAEALRIAPPSNDYGLIRKGTRATRQFEVSNTTDEPISVALSRSTCRCLYYEYVEAVPPKGKETITVTIDAARAKAGTLRETIKVTSKRDPSIAASFDVTATIR